MGREKQRDSEQPQAQGEQAAKKPYAKPVVRVLGTVRELTQVTHSGTNK